MRGTQGLKKGDLTQVPVDSILLTLNRPGDVGEAAPAPRRLFQHRSALWPADTLALCGGSEGFEQTGRAEGQ